jgi:hypothetical protein
MDMEIQFKKAERAQSKLRLAFTGVSFGGKTYTSLLVAKGLGGKVAVIDTENGSASLYSDIHDFDVFNLIAPYEPLKYVEAIKAAQEAGYDTLIIDSFSHAWNAEGGMLDSVDKLNANVANSGWRKMTPMQNRLMDTIQQSGMDVIVTMRDKTEYSYEKNDKGKIEPRKIGLAPIQRGDIEYEFSVVIDLNRDHMATVMKDRTRLFPADVPFSVKDDCAVNIGRQLREWLKTGKAWVPQCFRCREKFGTATDAVPEGKKESGYELCQPCLEAWKSANKPVEGQTNQEKV